MKAKTRASAIVIIVGLVFAVLGLGWYYSGEYPMKIDTETAMVTPKQVGGGFNLCQTTECIYVQDGDSIPFLGGLVHCNATGPDEGWYRVSWCADRNPRCDREPCEPPEPNPGGGSAHMGCRTSQECPGGACVNARIIGSKIVIDGGQCVLGRKAADDKALGGPSIKFTCVCTPL